MMIRTVLGDIIRCLRFYSRIPIPAMAWETNPHAAPDFRAMPRVVPVAGVVIGVFGAAAVVAAEALALAGVGRRTAPASPPSIRWPPRADHESPSKLYGDTITFSATTPYSPGIEWAMVRGAVTITVCVFVP